VADGKEELENKREQSKVDKEINKVLSAREQAYRRSVKTAGDALDISRQITEDIKDQIGMVRARSEADTGALGLARQLQKSAQAVTSELGNQGKIQRQIINDQNLLSSIRTEISNIEKKIGDANSDTARRIANSLTKQQQLLSEQEEIRNSLSYLSDSERKAAEKKLKRLDQQLRTQETIVKTAEDELAKQSQYEAGDIRRIIQLKQQEGIGEEIIRQREHELDIQRRIEDHTGVTGALVEGVGGIMQRLGMRSGIFQNAMELSAETMKDMSEETIRTAENIDLAKEALEEAKKSGDDFAIKQADAALKAAEQGKQFNKIQIALAGGSELAKGFGKALFDPLTVVLAIVDAFLDVDKAATDLQRLTGQNSTTLIGFNNRLASSVDFLETMADLTKQTGMNAQNIFSPDVLGGAAELKNTMGLAAEEAGGLAMLAQTTSGDIDAVTESIVGTTSEFNRANRSAVSQGQILRDVATTSDDIKASLGNNPALIAKAASAARRLGMSLKEVDSIASSLMDFESSIEAELEAQLLTGKQINLSKARELALNNDLAGLGKELFKNASDINEFGNMNRIQQEAQAKALGMTRDQLAKVAYQRALEKGMTDEQAAAAAGVNAEDMKRLAAQESLQKSLEKLTQAFAPMLEFVADIASGIATVVSPVAGIVSGIMKAAGAAKIFGANIGGLAKLAAGIAIIFTGKTLQKAIVNAFNPNITQGFFSTIRNSFSGLGDNLKTVRDRITGLFSKKAAAGAESLTDTVTKDAQGRYRDAKGRFAKAPGADKAKDIASDAKTKTPEIPKTDKTQDVISKTEEPKQSGEKIREFLTNLAAGLREMASMKVLGGALNMIPASLGLVAMIPGVVGAKLLEKVNGESLKESLVNLATGLKEMSGGKTLLGAFNLIPASLGLVAMIPGYVGAKLLQALDGEALKESLTGLANGISAMGSGKVLLGAVALPLASVGLLLLTPAIPTMFLLSGAGTAASTGLTALAGGLNAMAGTFVGSAALVAAAAGFALMTAGAIGLGAVALLGTAASTGLTSLAGGLSALGASAPYAAIGAGILALLGAAMIPLTYAISLLAPALDSLGTIVEKALGGLAGIITAAANGISQILGVITPASVLSLAALGPALLSAGAGLTAFSIASLVAAPGLGVLGAIAAMSSPLATVGTSLTVVASGIAAIAAALNSLETEKLEELKDLVITTAFAAPMVAATGAITDLISGLGGGAGEGDSNKALLEEIKLLRAAVEQDRVTKVYMDSNELDMRIVQGRSGQ